MTKQVEVNDFVKRQIKGSGKTYSPFLSFDEIAKHAEERMSEGFFQNGYRDGVRIVVADEKMTDLFVCPFVKIDENTQLKAERIFRQAGEEPYIQIRALNGTPFRAGKVEFILYRHDVLAENNEQTTNADWELISIHAVPKGIEKLPMGPVTMMRNQLELKGGTKALYSPQEWAEATKFWQEYAVLEPDD